MSDIAIKIENLKKQYKLGAIGGQTLNAELQSWWARKRGKEDPNLKIGQDYSNFGESFYALNGINLEIKKGEALGIIGGNGAGKSTLLKILSRVTAPTEGDVWIDGRIASMLEVGTGFHGELTGRENIYMNGAILGMTKKEVDENIESIIDFSECRQFIDTPVKRYSSGMYVKLAFAVASHLDAEIMIMDEVLAVGDMKFQKKCLGKMGDEAKEGKTVLYVSHNMSTIRNLCSRCIVMEKGRIIFSGDVEEAISVYMENMKNEISVFYNFENTIREGGERLGKIIHVNSVELVNKKNPIYKNTEKLCMRINWSANERVNFKFGISMKYCDSTAVGFAEGENFVEYEGMDENYTLIELDLCNMTPGLYYAIVEPYIIDSMNNLNTVDEVGKIFFEVEEGEKQKYCLWQRQYWGSVRLKDVRVISNSK